MILTRRHLARRTFLKGMGAAIALPALDAMTPAFAQGLGGQARAASPVRLAFTYVPNGISMVDWTPAAKGAGPAWWRRCSQLLTASMPVGRARVRHSCSAWRSTPRTCRK